MATITLSLSDAEQNAFQQLLDLALRNNGVGALSVVSHFFSLINQAAQQAVAPQAQVNASAAATATVAPAAPVAADPHSAAQSSAKPAAQSVTQPAASQTQQSAQHSGGILETIESALGFGHGAGQQHPASQSAVNHPAATVTSTQAATPAPAATTATPAASTATAQTSGTTPAAS